MNHNLLPMRCNSSAERQSNWNTRIFIFVLVIVIFVIVLIEMHIHRLIIHSSFLEYYNGLWRNAARTLDSFDLFRCVPLVIQTRVNIGSFRGVVRRRGESPPGRGRLFAWRDSATHLHPTKSNTESL